VDRPYTHANFTRLALEAFPELSEDFAAFIDSPRLQLSAFGRRLQGAKGDGDWDAYARGVRLVAELWRRPDHDLNGAIGFTLMKALDFDGPRGPRAWDCWPADLQRVALDSARARCAQVTALAALRQPSVRPPSNVSLLLTSELLMRLRRNGDTSLAAQLWRYAATGFLALAA
jgi:hypothetical protein